MNKRTVFMLFSLVALAGWSCGPGTATASTANQISFWAVHGIWFLIFMAIFPRITMLVATPYPIGLLNWLGWLFVPRILAAILATHFYWGINPVLCFVTWMVALAGTAGTYSKTISVVLKNWS